VQRLVEALCEDKPSYFDPEKLRAQLDDMMADQIVESI
jgi:hypothetical protein